MGLADRDYIRQRPRPMHGRGAGPRGVMRGWSVTTWIIAINVAVFLIGGMVLGNKLVASPGASYEVKGVVNDEGTITYTDIVSDAEWANRRALDEFRTSAGRLQQPLVDPATKPGTTNAPTYTSRSGKVYTHVGWRDVTVMPLLEAWGHFSTGKFWTDGEVWRILTFQFLHGSVTHILFNMLGLFFFGPMVESYLGGRRYLIFYLLCGGCGALMYLALNLLGFVGSMMGLQLPLLLFQDPYVPLIGASAGVFGVLIAAAYLRPRDTILVMWVIPMPLKWAAYGFVALAFVNLYTGGHNAGGDAAHIGGALAGYMLIRRPHVLRRFQDAGGSVVAGARRLVPGGRSGGSAGGGGKTPDQAEVDRILAKLSAEGMSSLSSGEMRTLERASRDEATRRRG